MASDLGKARCLVDEALQALVAATSKDGYSAIITAERAIPRLADALGLLAKMSPNTSGACECTGLGFGIDAKYHISRGPGKKLGLGDKILKHAHEHYSEDGWDVLVETVPAQAVHLVVCDCTSLDEAFKRVEEAFGCKLYNEKREDIRAAGDCE